MGDWGACAVLGIGGAGAGWGARAALARLGCPVPAGVAEVAVGVLWAVVALRVAAGGLPWWWAPVPVTVGWFAVVLTTTDLAQRRLPNAVTLPAYPVVLGLLAVAGAAGGAGAFGRAVAAGAALLALYAAVHLAAPSQLGAGDVKLAGVVGAVLGAVGWPALLLGQLVAALVTAALAVVDRHGRGAPHGPGMLAGALLIALFPGTVAPLG